jgi:hypothetical protein
VVQTRCNWSRRASAIELPEDIGEELEAEWKDLPRAALEAIALEGYRSGALAESQVWPTLRSESRTHVNRLRQPPTTR